MSAAKLYYFWFLAILIAFLIYFYYFTSDYLQYSVVSICKYKLIKNIPRITLCSNSNSSKLNALIVDNSSVNYKVVNYEMRKINFHNSTIVFCATLEHNLIEYQNSFKIQFPNISNVQIFFTNLNSVPVGNYPFTIERTNYEYYYQSFSSLKYIEIKRLESPYSTNCANYNPTEYHCIDTCIHQQFNSLAICLNHCARQPCNESLISSKVTSEIECVNCNESELNFATVDDSLLINFKPRITLELYIILIFSMIGKLISLNIVNLINYLRYILWDCSFTTASAYWKACQRNLQISSYSQAKKIFHL